MAYPNQADSVPNPTAKAVCKQTAIQLQIVPYDLIDWNVSGVTPGVPPAWTDYRKLFYGFLPTLGAVDPATQLGIGDSLFLQFIKPIMLGNVVIGALPAALVGQVSVTYLDGVLENLVWLGSFPLGECYAPPVRNVPVADVTILNTGLAAADVYGVTLVMPTATVAGGGGGGIIASPNNYYSDNTLNAIPPGLLGITLNFGFVGQGFIVKNSSASEIEFSEDAGVTWEKLDAHDAVWFDFKRRTQLIVRDPLGAGGQAYRVWAW